MVSGVACREVEREWGQGMRQGSCCNKTVTGERQETIKASSYIWQALT